MINIFKWHLVNDEELKFYREFDKFIIEKLRKDKKILEDRLFEQNLLLDKLKEENIRLGNILSKKLFKK